MKTVIVAEKKSVAEDLVKALLNGRAETHDGFYSSGEIAITYCSRHLVELAEPDEYPGKNWSSWQFSSLPLIPEGLEFLCKPVSERAAKQLGVIKKLAREVYRVKTSAGDLQAFRKIFGNRGWRQGANRDRVARPALSGWRRVRGHRRSGVRAGAIRSREEGLRAS